MPPAYQAQYSVSRQRGHQETEMSYTTVSVSRRVVMLKVRPKPGARKQRSPPPDQDPIVQDRSVKRTEKSEALLDFAFSTTPDKFKTSPDVVVPLRNRSKLFAVAIVIVVMVVGIVLFLRWVIHLEFGLPETRKEAVVTQPEMYNIRPRVNFVGHSSVTPPGRPQDSVIGSSGWGGSGQSAYAVQTLSASSIVPDDLSEMADRKLLLPSDVSGACSVGPGVVSDLVTCLNRHGAQAR